MRHGMPLALAISASAALLLACVEQPVGPLAAPGDPSVAKATGPQVAAPSNPSATTSGQSQIDVAWQDNSGDESRFEVHRSISGPSGAFVLLSSTRANVTTYRDEGLTAGTQYCYAIRAIRVRGGGTSVSSFSATSCATTDPLPPPPPPAPMAVSDATATATNSSTVAVRWTAASLSAAQFRIDRSTDGGAVWSLAGTALSHERSYTDTGVPSERGVCYRVVAFNTSGTASPSNTACATPPAAPANLTATLVDAQTWELAWADNSAVEDAYEVWAYSMWVPCCGSEGGTGCASGYSEGDYLIARIPANSTVYRTPVDTSLECGSTEFWVRATNGTTGFSSFAIFAVTP